MDPNALIGDKLKAMSEALAAGEPLPEIDQDDLGRVPKSLLLSVMMIMIIILIIISIMIISIMIIIIMIITIIIGAGKCIVEFEKMSTAVMEDVGTFMIKIVRLGDTSNQVKKNPHSTSCDLI